MPFPLLRLSPVARAAALLSVWILTGALCRAAKAEYSPVEWSDPAHAPDELPALKSAPRLRTPEELSKSPDVGYILFEAVLDEKGRPLSLAHHATNPAYYREAEVRRDDFRFSPGKRNGRAVNTGVSFAAIFNPESAAANAPEARPRLLQVSLVRVRGLRRPAPRDATEDLVVFGDVTVDATGLVTDVKNVPSQFERAIRIAVKNWRFAPARQAGQPVAAEAHVPFVLAEPAGRPRGHQTLPRVVRQPPPVYPFVMRASGMRGDVVVDFVVDIEGRVRNAFVVRSLNPGFDDAALEAVTKWQFEPGRIDDVPVPTHMQVPIVFHLQDTYQGGSDGTEVERKADIAKLPPEFRYDTPPKLRGAARPVYPYAALTADRDGEATVGYMVDPQGHVVQAKVTKATAPEFGAALLAAVERFTYEPALKGGRPCPALLTFRQVFSRDEGYGLVSDGDFDVLWREQKKPQTIVGAGKLDHPLKPISRQPPVFPVEVTGADGHGEADIEFLIDEDGRVRLPRIVSATNDAFGYAAVQAVANWRFEPPTNGGHAVVARARVPIQFNAPKASARSAAPHKPAAP